MDIIRVKELLPMANTNINIRMDADLKRVKKRGFDISLLTDIIKKLAAGEPLLEKNRNHPISEQAYNRHRKPPVSVFFIHRKLCVIVK